MAVTWNPLDKNSDITLSNGDLRATRGPANEGAGYEGARATASKSSGKFYFEAIPSGSSSSYTAIGIATSSWDLASSGYNNYSWWYGSEGYYTHADSYIDAGATYTAGNVIQIAIDMDAGKIWWGKNGTWLGSGNPATGANPAFSSITGTIFPATVLYLQNTYFTVYFLASSWTYSAPSGFESFESLITHTLPIESLMWETQLLSQSGNNQINLLSVENLAWTTQLPTSQNGDYLAHDLPVENLIWTAQPLILTPILPIESITWATTALIQQLAHDIPSGTLVWMGQPFDSQCSHSLPSSAIIWAIQPIQAIFYLPDSQQSSSIYRAYLYADGYDRLELPIASFQSTRRNGEQTYLSIVVPNPVTYLDAIEDRLTGEIVIYSGFVVSGVETLTEIIRANLSSFRYDLGATSGSATLTGYKQVTYTNPKTIALAGISYRSVTDGIRQIRCQPDMWLNPGDTADLGSGELMVIDKISYAITPTRASMDVIEVDL